MNADALPIPKLDRAIHPSHLRTLCRVLGIALVAQALFPPYGMIASFPGIWALLGGAALTTFGFLPSHILKPGVLLSIVGGVAFIGLVSLFVGVGPVFGSFFSAAGATAACIGLFMWAKEGHSTLAFWLVVGGQIAIALGLLIPYGGQVPLLTMFFAHPLFPIMGKIGLFLVGLAWIGLNVLILIFVVLKGANADRKLAGALGSGLICFMLCGQLLFGILVVWQGGYFMLAAYHIGVISTAWVMTMVFAGSIVIKGLRDGDLKRLF